MQKILFFIHELGHTQFENLLKHYLKDGVTSRVHKNTGQSSLRNNTLLSEDIEAVVTFIKNYGETHGLLLSGRLPMFKDFKVISLPSAETKGVVYHNYCQTTKLEPGKRQIGFTSFRTLWAKYVPYVTCMKPASDLCDVCQTNVTCILRTANMPDDEKDETL